jgi:hypothetical protein
VLHVYICKFSLAAIWDAQFIFPFTIFASPLKYSMNVFSGTAPGGSSSSYYYWFTIFLNFFLSLKEASDNEIT